MSSPALSPLARRLFPSITDFLFLGLLLTRLHPSLFYDGDTAWHLWAGARVLDSGPAAIADPLSFTRAGELWRSWQWVGEALLALAYRHAGYMGVAVLCTTVFAAVFAWLYRALARETDHPPAAALASLLAAQVGLTYFLARPALFSLPLFLGVWELVRKPGRERAAIIAVPLLTAVWANTHPSAFLAPAVAAFAAVTRPEARGRLAIAAAASAALLGATPWGYAWLGDLAPSGANLGFLLRIDEWRTPGFREPRFWGLLLYLLLALTARRGARPLSRGETLWGLGWLAAVLLSARLAPYAVLAWAPLLARDLARLGAAPGPTAAAGAPAGPSAPARAWSALSGALAPFERALRPGLWPAALGLVALLAAPAIGPLYPQVARGFPPRRFPEQALAEAQRLGLGPRVFNAYLWGGYVSWQVPGRYRVFIDGRAGFFGDAALADYLAVMELRPEWREALARARPDWILVPPGTPIATAAPLTGAWRVVYRDGTAVVLAPASGP